MKGRSRAGSNQSYGIVECKLKNWHVACSTAILTWMVSLIAYTNSSAAACEHKDNATSSSCALLKRSVVWRASHAMAVGV